MVFAIRAIVFWIGGRLGLDMQWMVSNKVNDGAKPVGVLYGRQSMLVYVYELFWIGVKIEPR